MRKCNKSLLLLMIFAMALCILTIGSVSAVSAENNTAGLANTSSPEYQINSNHTGQSNYTGPQANTTKWTYKNITVHGSAVTGTDGTIYVGSYEGKLYAFNPDGTLKWNYTTSSNIFSSPAVGKDGTIYISDWENSTLYAINSNGTLQWKYNMGNYNYGSSPTIGTDGTIYIANTNDINGTVYAIYPSGKLNWIYTTEGPIYGSSAAIDSDGTVYIEDKNTTLYAINSKGALNWEYTSSGQVYSVCTIYYSSPSIGPDGTVYILRYGPCGYLMAINMTTGKPKWSYPSGWGIEESFYGAPAISSDGTIYFISASKIYAVNPDGTLKWTYSTGGAATAEATSTTIGSDGTIYFGSSTGIYAITDKGTKGLLKWSYATGQICGTPIIDSDGTLYIGSMDKGFYAFNDIVANFNADTSNVSSPLTVQFTDESTGTLKSWKWDFGDGTSSAEQNPNHIYSKAGTYKVTLTTTLSNGSIRTVTSDITVKSDLTAPTVTISPSEESFSTTLTVTLKATDNSGSATIYYTTDGSDPRTSSTRHIYTTSIMLTSTTNIQYAAVDISDNWSPVYNKTYTELGPVSPVIYNITSGMTNDQIQSIITKAAPGSTIIFREKTYQNLYLTINKQLTIISYVGTKITASSSSPVFLINGAQAAGTTISGFNIINTGTGSGILINNTSNVNIFNDHIISTGGSAVLVSESSNTIISSSSLTNSVTGINISNSENTKVINNCIITGNSKRGVGIYSSNNTTVTNSTIKNNGNNDTAGLHSDEGGAYVNNSNTVKIINNKIEDNSQGVTLNSATNVNVNKNTIKDNYGEGVLLAGTLTNIIIGNNTIDGNANGIEIDYTKGRYITIKSNYITNNVDRSLSDGEDTGSGISLGSDHEYGLKQDEMDDDDKTVIIESNAFYGNHYRILDGHDDRVHSSETSPIHIGYNVYGFEWSGDNPCEAVSGAGESSNPFCCKWRTYSAHLHLELNDGVYTAYFTDAEGNILTDIPSIPITITTPIGFNVTVWTNNGTADYSINSGSVNGLYGIVTAAYYKQYSTARSPDSKTIHGLGYIPGNSNSNNNGNQTNNPGGNGGSGNNGGHGTNGAGGNSGSGSSNGASSGASASTGLATAAAADAGSAGSAGQSGSNGQQSQPKDKSKTAQELFVDKTVKNPEFWSILGVIVLIVLIFGAYYRKDLMAMVKKSKK